jgi:hypothetical protein
LGSVWIKLRSRDDFDSILLPIDLWNFVQVLIVFLRHRFYSELNLQRIGASDHKQWPDLRIVSGLAAPQLASIALTREAVLIDSSGCEMQTRFQKAPRLEKHRTFRLSSNVH